MESNPPRETLSTLLLIQEAATYLGVCANTLRTWDREGKLRAHRHPVNGYRLYLRDDLDKLLERALSHGGADGTWGTT